MSELPVSTLNGVADVTVTITTATLAGLALVVGGVAVGSRTSAPLEPSPATIVEPVTVVAEPVGEPEPIPATFWGAGGRPSPRVILDRLKRCPKTDAGVDDDCMRHGPDAGP